jgi:glycosyltransferase involved in cell wall biosynthesis
MKRVLFLVMHRPNRSPSQRYRFEQYFDYLADNGIICHMSYLIDPQDDKVLYQPGKYTAKLWILIKSILKRHSDLYRVKNFDYIFIQREAFMTGTTIFERLLAKSKKPIIFDFDDSIWLLDENAANRNLSFLKNPNKTKRIISLSSTIVAGNEYLADYARQFNTNVKIIPTTIDTKKYQPIPKKPSETVVIGWTGSFSTIKHFEDIVPVLLRIQAKYGDKVKFEVLGDPDYENHELGIKGLPWRAETETKDLNRFDIGIMPLPDNEWTKGKCGAKGLQYMGMAIPTIMSPVGVNSTIISDSENGFLAGSKDEWYEKLSQLIDSPILREKLGSAGRKTVEEKYSVTANQERYLELFN